MDNFEIEVRLRCINDDLEKLQEQLQKEKYISIKKISFCDFIKIKLFSIIKNGRYKSS